MEGRRPAHLVGVGPQGYLKRSRETKVGDLEVALAIDEEVVGFEVAVHDAAGVQVGETEDELPGEALCARPSPRSGSKGSARRTMTKSGARARSDLPLSGSMGGR
jgi:hypothetical protein